MKVIAIVQARMSSVRLPNKTLLLLAGKPTLAHVINRLQECKTLNQIIVATSTDPGDDLIEKWCRDVHIDFYRGSLSDVLDRYYCAAKEFNAEVVVRITADCPAIDSEIVDEVVTKFLSNDYDTCALAGEFPDGLDCQVFSLSALEKAWREAKLPSEREHVGPYIDNNPELFRVGHLYKFKGLSHHRWTLDEPEDYEFLKIVFTKLYGVVPHFKTKDILELMEKEPLLMNINSQIIRNQGYINSLKAEQN
jgi:spore coat polysaccharide biosynthesis protein SpsF (cytidylyltransferase family)